MIPKITLSQRRNCRYQLFNHISACILSGLISGKYRKLTHLMVLGVFVLLINPISHAQNSPHVVFVNPGVSTTAHETGGFWYNVSSFMQAAADDFGIKLEVLYAERNHLALRRLVKDVADREEKPDYLIVVNEIKQGTKQLEIAMDANIKTFMILNTLTAEEEDKFGSPRKTHPNWIGSLVPDNYFAGYQISKQIVETARSKGLKGKDGLIHLIGFAGDFVTPASVERNNGLEDYISELPDTELNQLFTVSWSKDDAKRRASKALARFPEISAIWAANDPIALGAMEAVIESGRKPGVDIVIGGLNWDMPALEQIRMGSISLSMGGHFMTGGWAIVLLHDYHHGKDFKNNDNVHLKMKIFDKIDRSNVNRYLEKFLNRNWKKIDFTRFSKVKNPSLTQYNFSLKGVFEQPDL